jgi:hypothetical protein
MSRFISGAAHARRVISFEKLKSPSDVRLVTFVKLISAPTKRSEILVVVMKGYHTEGRDTDTFYFGVGSGGIEQGPKKQEEKAAADFKWMQENPQATAAQFVEQATKISRGGERVDAVAAQTVSGVAVLGGPATLNLLVGASAFWPCYDWTVRRSNVF